MRICDELYNRGRETGAGNAITLFSYMGVRPDCFVSFCPRNTRRDGKDAETGKREENNCFLRVPLVGGTMIRQIFFLAIAVFSILCVVAFASVVLGVGDTRNYMPHMVKLKTVAYNGDPVANETLVVTPVIPTDDTWFGILSFFGVSPGTNDVSNQTVIRTGDNGTAVLHMVPEEKYNVKGENFSFFVYPYDSEYTIYIRRN